MAVGSTEQSASRTVVSSVDHDPVAPVLEGVDFVDRYFGGGHALVPRRRVHGGRGWVFNSTLVIGH
jgi:hypothetical protein